MLPKQYEVYQVQANYRGCTDERPAVIISAPTSTSVTIAYITGQMDLYRPSVHFLIDDASPDFKTTGLKKRCYVDGDEIADLSLGRLVRKRGLLSGQMLANFIKWI